MPAAAFQSDRRLRDSMESIYSKMRLLLIEPYGLYDGLFGAAMQASGV